MHLSGEGSDSFPRLHRGPENRGRCDGQGKEIPVPGRFFCFPVCGAELNAFCHSILDIDPPFGIGLAISCPLA